MSEPTTPIEGKFADYLTIEASIANDPDAAITAFSPNALPGLLHTAEYRRSLLQLVTGQTHSGDRPSIDASLERMHRRQERIFTGEQRPNVSSIIAETALTHVIRLRRDSGRQQLGHITNLAVNGLVDLYIVPAEIPLMSAGVAVAANNQRGLWLEEMGRTFREIDEPALLADYFSVLDGLKQVSLTGDEAIRFVRSQTDAAS